MGKNNKFDGAEDAQEMTLEEAKAYRASLNAPKSEQKREQDRREDFRKFWAENKSKYGKDKELEEVLWLHLKAIKQDNSEDFEAGLNHFGLTKN